LNFKKIEKEEKEEKIGNLKKLVCSVEKESKRNKN